MQRKGQKINSWKKVLYGTTGTEEETIRKKRKKKVGETKRDGLMDGDEDKENTTEKELDETINEIKL